MTTSSELSAAEREAALEKLRRRMGRLLRRGETAEYERLSALYARQKAEHVQRAHGEHIAGRRAARAALRAREAAVQPDRWKLPRGFGVSPLAEQRARSGWRPREEPRGPGPGLRPWRRGGSLMSERVWRP